jgi:hypothetical protein
MRDVRAKLPDYLPQRISSIGPELSPGGARKADEPDAALCRSFLMRGHDVFPDAYDRDLVPSGGFRAGERP